MMKPTHNDAYTSLELTDLEHPHQDDDIFYDDDDDEVLKGQATSDHHEKIYFDEIDFERVENRRKQRCRKYSVGFLSLAVILLAVSVFYVSKSTENKEQHADEITQQPDFDGASSSSSSNLLLLKEHWKPMRIDTSSASSSELLAKDSTISSLSMSDDGEVLAVTYNSIASVLTFSGDSMKGWLMAAPDLADDSSSTGSKVVQVRLSGDGKTLVLGMMSAIEGTSTRTYFSQPIAQVLQSIDTHWNNYSYSKPLEMVEPDSGIVPTDLAVSRDGTICAVGYGANRTTTLTSCVGDGVSEDCLDDSSFQNAGTNILPCIAGSWRAWDYASNEMYPFPNTYESDNQGFSVDMSSDGSRIIQSSEHNIQGSYHMSTLVNYFPYERAYFGHNEELYLMDDYDELCQDNGGCEQQQVRSDVAISDDGNVAVVAVQRWNASTKKLQYIIYTTVAAVEMSDDWDIFWARIDDLILRDGGLAGESFSVTMSGDATTLVLARSGILEIFESDQNKNGAWQVLETAQQSHDDDSVDVADVLVALSQDGSRIAVATNNHGPPQRYNNFIIYQRI